MLSSIVKWDFKAAIFVFKDFSACENRASAETDVGRSCAIAFMRVCTYLRTTVTNQRPV